MRMRFESSKPPPRKKRRFPKRELKCRFCRDKAEDVDYKDLTVLLKMTTSQGKHFSRKRSGNCAWHQRLSRRALKRARFMALLPFCG